MSVAGIFEVLARVAAWPVRFLLASADVVLRLFGKPAAEDDHTSSEEIEVLVRRGTAQGVFLPVQEQMIARIFDYADRATRDVMTPRMEIIALEAETLAKVALRAAQESGFSRFPVFRGNLDRILGYIHIKDLIWADPDTPLEKLTRQVVFIPEGATLPQAFKLLTRAGRHMGVVLDEYGGTDGVITLEDLIEVIVGEIEDEHSPVAEVPTRGQQGEWRIAGGTAIAEVGELLDLNFEPGGVYTTLAGFIMAELGEIPRVGDAVHYAGYRFVVDEMERFRIQTVRVLAEPPVESE
jgi:putative hemolysin